MCARRRDAVCCVRAGKRPVQRKTCVAAGDCVAYTNGVCVRCAAGMVPDGERGACVVAGACSVPGRGVSLRCGDGSYADDAGVCRRPARTALTRSVRCKQPRVRGGRGTLHGVRHRGGDVPERQRVPGERGAWRDVPRLRRDGRVRGLQRGVLPLRLGVPCVHGRVRDVLGRRVVRDVQRRALHDGDGGVQGEERDGGVFRGDRQRGRVRCVRRRALSAGQGVPPVRRRVRRVSRATRRGVCRVPTGLS